MRTIAAALAWIALVAIPVSAQDRGGRYGRRSGEVPPGHLPPPGECRVWYDDRPAGHQPAPTSCREAERVAARDPYARVVYGGTRDRRDEGSWGRDDDRRGRGRAIPRGRQYPDQYPYPGRRTPYPGGYPSPDRYPGGRGGYEGIPFDNGYRDGFEKGREDARDRDAYDPVRHGRYRSADHGYKREHGSKEQYKAVYRDGFRTGYDDGYREAGSYPSGRRRGGIQLPWPF